MVDEINILSESTIDKIAAGEVIERPSSVVKELVENSIDAGAGSISVEIRNGGISYIRVTDNGRGISKSQIKKAFLRHTTSKIRNADDLIGVKTLGFRGEALSSIAAVSKVNLITHSKEDPVGISYRIEGGKEVSLSDIGAPQGTTFIACDLFYNTPVRKKFLNSPLTEGIRIEELIEHLALSHPEIAFRLINNNSEKLATPGNGSLTDTIYRVYGREITQNLLPVEYESENIKIEGFLGKSIINRGNRKFETFFVNKRYVHGKQLSKAVEDGYKGYLMQHQYPFFILNLYFPTGSVDVNFHPKKEEVRIENKEEIYTELTMCVHKRLILREDIDTIPLEDSEPVKNPEPEKPRSFGIEPFEKKKDNFPDIVLTKEEEKERKYSKVPESRFFKEEDKSKDNKIHYEQRSFLTPDARPDFDIIGQVFDTYWIISFKDKMYIVDQHAAHEKVNFERMMKRVGENKVASQLVSPPVMITMNREEQEIFNKYKTSFEALGFKVAPFGGMDFAITEVPYELDMVDKKQLFYDILEDASKIKNMSDSNLIKERIATMACKASIKGNQHISKQEMEELLNEMLTLENPYHCPHGRPTMVAFSREDLDKLFKRIV